MSAAAAVRLAEIAESIEYGVTASASNDPVGPKFLRITDIQNGGVAWENVPWCVCNEREVASARLKLGDIVFARTGATTGKSFLVRDCPANAVFASYLIRVRLGEMADNRFVSHFFQTSDYWAQITKSARGVAQPGVNATTLKDLKIPLPPLLEQRRIADILDKADALRAKRRAAIQKLDELTQSIFLDMFGDPATNPKGWPQLPLAKLLAAAEVFTDGDWVESKDQDPNGDVRLIQLADIGDGSYLDKSSRFLTKQTALRLRYTPLKVGDLLVARMPDPLGRACIFPGDRKDAATVVDVCIIRPRNANPNPVWLMCCINTQGFRGQVARLATGTTRQRVSRGNLSKLQIIAPPLRHQEAFTVRVDCYRQVRERMALAVSECDQLFASLQHRAFQGEL